MSGNPRKKSQRRSVSPSRTPADGTGDSAAHPTDRLDTDGQERTADTRVGDPLAALESKEEISPGKQTTVESSGERVGDQSSGERVGDQSSGEFAATKRAVSLGFGLKSEAVRPSLEVHPLIRDGVATAPLFNVGITGGVGRSAGRSIDKDSLAFYQFTDLRWYRTRSGIPMIKCFDFIEQRTYFVPRSVVVESTYTRTVEEIDDRDKWLDEQAGVQSVFLAKRQELGESGVITLPHAVTGYLEESLDQDDPEKGSVTVRPGEHAIVRFLTRQVAPKQWSPFSLVVSVEGREVVISSDLAWGVDESHNELAQELNLSQSVSADRIMAVFAETDWIAQYLPSARWLRDEEIHYVTPEEMGAVFVLERMPAPGEAADAKQKDEARYTEGASTPGVRIGEHIYIQHNDRGTGTEYHEAIHKLSHPASNLILGHWFNEGVTEYLTRRLTAELVRSKEIVRNDDQYGPQYRAIEALVQLTGVTDAELNEAYFRGILEPLYEKVANAGVHAPFTLLAPFSLDGYAKRLGSSTATAALQMLSFACGDITQAATDDGTTTTTTITITSPDTIPHTTVPDRTGDTGGEVS
jgi:hypothetical protein